MKNLSVLPFPLDRRHPRLVSDLGLGLLLPLAIEILTGMILAVFLNRLIPRDAPWEGQLFQWLADRNLLYLQDVGYQTDLHVYAGYASMFLVVAKAAASWPTLRGWWPKQFGPGRLQFEKSMAWAVLIFGLASYLSGIATVLRPFRRGQGIILDLHLWLSVLLIVPLAWHVYRYLPTGLRIFWIQIKRSFVQVSHAKPTKASAN